MSKPLPNKASFARRNLALGFSAPIIGAAVAIIFGLIVFDLTQTTIEAWVWLVIQAMIGTGVVLGARWSSMAEAWVSPEGKRLSATKGAANVNLVITIIFVAVTTSQAFSYTATAVEKLRSYYWEDPVYQKDIEQGKEVPIPSGPEYVIDPLTPETLFNDFLPAFGLLLVALVGIYLFLTERTRERTFA